MKNIHLKDTTMEEGLKLYQERFGKTDEEIKEIKWFLDCLGIKDASMLDLNNAPNFENINVIKIADYIEENELCQLE